MLIVAALAGAQEPAPAGPAPTEPAAAGLAPTEPAPAAPTPAAPAAGTPVAPPGFVPAQIHATQDPLLPQKYREVPAGKYPCSVRVKVGKDGRLADVAPVACDEEAFWALAAAMLTWSYTPASMDGVAVDSERDWTTVFEVRTLLPRKHIVGFVGAAASVGGAGMFGGEFRIHLGEQISATVGLDLDRDVLTDTEATAVWVPSFRADVAISSRRRHFERRGVWGFMVGAYGDPYGAVGGYAGFRAEAMTPVPGLSFGGDAGVAMLFTNPETYEDMGFWPRAQRDLISPWLRASVIWYAPLPRDQFVVVPREDDAWKYVPVFPEPDVAPDLDGQPFPGVRAIHWSEIEPSRGDNTPTPPGFELYPPGSYRCDIRVLIEEDGSPKEARVEHCPQAGKEAGRANIMDWRWPRRPGKGQVQAVFPAPIFVRRDDAEQVPVQTILLLVDGQTKPIPKRTPVPPVYVHAYLPPEWTHTRPTMSCFVDVDIDPSGKVLKRAWVSGEIEVQRMVWDVLDQWDFYPVPVDGELVPVRVRLSMCEG
jgi:hypothetical protein